MRLPDKFRFCAGTALRLANRLLSPFDRLAERSGPAGTGAIFIVGLPRSGTTLAYELIVQAFDVAYLTRMSEFTFGAPSLTTRLISPFLGAPVPSYESLYGRIPGILSPAENSVLWARWFEEDPDLGHCVMLQQTSDKAAEARRVLASVTAIAGKPFVFKNVYLTISIPALLETFPGAQVVVVRRNFDAVCASVYKARLEIGGGVWWSIKPPFWRDTTHKDVLEQTAFQCVRADQILSRDMERVSSTRVLAIEYEDLCASPADCLQSIAAWAGSSIAGREGAPIPARFKQSLSQAIPESERDRFAGIWRTLSLDREAYFMRVDEFSAQRREIGGHHLARGRQHRGHTQ